MKRREKHAAAAEKPDSCSNQEGHSRAEDLASRGEKKLKTKRLGIGRAGRRRRGTGLRLERDLDSGSGAHFKAKAKCGDLRGAWGQQ